MPLIDKITITLEEMVQIKNGLNAVRFGGKVITIISEPDVLIVRDENGQKICIVTRQQDGHDFVYTDEMPEVQCVGKL